MWKVGNESHTHTLLLITSLLPSKRLTDHSLETRTFSDIENLCFYIPYIHEMVLPYLQLNQSILMTYMSIYAKSRELYINPCFFLYMISTLHIEASHILSLASCLCNPQAIIWFLLYSIYVPIHTCGTAFLKLICYLCWKLTAIYKQGPSHRELSYLCYFVNDFYPFQFECIHTCATVFLILICYLCWKLTAIYKQVLHP